MVHLVFHQRDKGSDYDADSRHTQCRDLECNGLSATSGHEAERIMPGPNAFYDFPLYPAEIIIAKILSEYLSVIRFQCMFNR